MKHFVRKIFSIVLVIIGSKGFASNYTALIFKSDTVLSIFRETHLGKNFFGAGSNNVYAYNTKLGVQVYCFQFGINAEREFINTTAYNQNYLQRTKGLGLFLGFELPVTKRIGLGIHGIYTFYKPNIEQPIYTSNDSKLKLFDYGYYSIFQTQFRFNYQLNKEFSLLGTAHFNLSPYIYNEGKIDQSNFFRFNVGLRYSLYPLNNNLASNNDVNNKRLKIFAGSNLEWKNASIPDFIGKEYAVSNKNLIQLSRASSDNVRSQVYALLGIADKKNNMILFGINQRDYIQYAKNYQQLYSSSNWKLEIKDLSSRLAMEVNLFSFVPEQTVKNFKPVYPFFRTSVTYSAKKIDVTDGWDYRSYATDTSYYEPHINTKAQTKLIEINNSLGLAIKLNRLYISAGLNVFNRTYGDVKLERVVRRDYYLNKSPKNYITSKTEILPVQETKGWFSKPNKLIDPMNVFFTIGIVL
jgi:hypothetical protein